MKIVFLLAVFWIQTYIVIGAIPNCCTSKNVGGLEYTLLREEDTSQFGCLTNCVYEKVEDGRKYCFGAGNEKVECKEGDSLVCGEDLKTLHGLLNASSHTVDAHCCNNGISTNNIPCGNGTDCFSVCEIQATCAKVVLNPEEGEDYCSSRDSRNLKQHGMTLNFNCKFCDAFGHSRSSTTTCNIMAWGIEKTSPPSYPDFCSKKSTYYGIDFKQTCCGANTKCDVCDCCTPAGPLYFEYEKCQLGMTSLFPSSACQTSTSTSTNLYTPPPVNIEWKSGMKPIEKCVKHGTAITFNWNSTNSNHNVVRLIPKAFTRCNFTGKDTENRTGPFKLEPAPAVNYTHRYFFASGVGDDCKNGGMKAEINLSNDCGEGCPAGWKKYETKCYKLFDGPLKGDQAERACQICDGHLASINSKGENTFITNLGLEGFPYIGGVKTKDGDWGWIDGSTWNYTNWAQTPTQPTGDGNNMNVGDSGWNDLSSLFELPYVCESFLGKKSQNCENLDRGTEPVTGTTEPITEQ